MESARGEFASRPYRTGEEDHRVNRRRGVDHVAEPARRRALAEDVPGDLAIAGFGDFELASAHGLALTTVRVPGFAIGEEAARLIVENPGTAADKPRIVDLGFKIIRRETA